MVDKSIKINRAPVLTLWGAVVAERLGFDRQEALTLGKTVAGMNAQAKGRRLGIFEPARDKPETARDRKLDEVFYVELLGRSVAAVNTAEGVRATAKDAPVKPESVERYLEKKFGEDLQAVRRAMQELAHAYPPRELAREAYDLYEKFRPAVPMGVTGWGAEGELDLEKLRSLRPTTSHSG